MKTPEQMILLDLLRGEMPVDIKQADQERLFELFKRHRLLSFAPGDFIDQLRPDIAGRWHEAIRNFTLRSMRLTGELERVCAELSRQKLEIYSIKGPVLSNRLFNDVGKRHYTDLDLVVRRDQLSVTVEALKDLGYLMVYPNENLSQEEWEYYFLYKKDVALVNKFGNIVLELHVEIFRMELVRDSSASFSWETLKDEKIGAVQVKCLDLSTSFLYLIYHGGQHQYFRLFWLKDIDVALRKWDLNHKKVLENAISLGVDRLLGMGLLLSKEVFGTEIPAEYDHYLANNKSVLSRLIGLSYRRFLGPERETRTLKINRYRFVLLLQPGFAYFRSIIGNIFHRRRIRKKLGGF